MKINITYSAWKADVLEPNFLLFETHKKVEALNKNLTERMQYESGGVEKNVFHLD